MRVSYSITYSHSSQLLPMHVSHTYSSSKVASCQMNVGANGVLGCSNGLSSQLGCKPSQHMAAFTVLTHGACRTMCSYDLQLLLSAEGCCQPASLPACPQAHLAAPHRPTHPATGTCRMPQLTSS
jgi:hypothetical protein